MDRKNFIKLISEGSPDEINKFIESNGKKKYISMVVPYVEKKKEDTTE